MNNQIGEILKELNNKELTEIKTEINRLIFLNNSMRFLK